MTSTAHATAPDLDPAAAAHLAALGAHDALLSDADRAALDRDGYVIWHGAMDPEWCGRLGQRIDALIELEAADDVSQRNRSGSPFHREPGCLRLPDLVNKGEVFDRAWLDPRLLAAVLHVLRRPFRLSALSYREGKVGGGAQDLHADWGQSRDGRSHVVGALWLVDAMHAGNGATRIVPGSHRRSHAELVAARAAGSPCPGEVLIEVPAGSVVVYDALTWHGGTLNRTGERRRMIHSFFCAREHPQQLDQAEFLRVRTAERLTPAARWVLDA